MENQAIVRPSQPGTEPNKPTRHKTYVLIVLIVFLLFFANLLKAYPGVPNVDSNYQYAQAINGHFTDWHPPIMAWLWSMLRLIADGTGPLFVVHVFFYWMGIGLIALTLSRIGRNQTAWAIVAVGAFPWFIKMNTQIFKDVGMAVSFLTGYSLCLSYRARGVKVPSGIIVIATIFIVYGILVRANGTFAGAPLIIWMFWPILFCRPDFVADRMCNADCDSYPCFRYFQSQNSASGTHLSNAVTQIVR